MNITNGPVWGSYYAILVPAWSPDGSKIAFYSRFENDENLDIFVVEVDGSNLDNLTNSPANDTSPAWSPFITE